MQGVLWYRHRGIAGGDDEDEEADGARIPITSISSQIDEMDGAGRGRGVVNGGASLRACTGT